MSKKNIIAVSQRVDVVTEYSECRDGIDQNLIRWVLELGGVPVQIPNVLGEQLSVWIGSVEPKAIILSGGNDIGAAESRDLTEKYILEYASLRELPVLGICRGMQVMAVHAGATLSPVLGHVGNQHRLSFDDRFNLLKFPNTVNSFHQYGFRSCPPLYNPIAKTEDGVIEAMAHSILPWEGWMFHPEREFVFDSYLISRARDLFTR
ncbi:gamma-glutamyl-gamma-aminobutyrate hydrolase family protein [Alphaproteobacteria bacterium]|nr:gamma-glutamyl-gamma-aminobutyrate hydrolase family protein [Alphaproteobacteria bacterium]